jgi:hypothetical protein
MRNSFFAAAGSLAVLVGASVVPAGALSIDPSAMRAAVDVVGQAEKVWCYGYGCGYRRYGYYGYRPHYYGYGYRPHYYGYRPHYGHRRGYYWR